jgi:predicted aconitase
MKLTREEQEMLDGRQGDAVQKAMELLVAVGDSYNAERMVFIGSAHLVSANPIGAGKGGTRFIRDLAEKGAKFKVPTTTNPASLELWKWKDMNYSEELYQRQETVSDHIAKMGGILCNTCTPYLIGHIPRMGEHVAWGESSAVLFLNAVLGARTNREGGPSAIAAAITGRTPAYGYHLDENRYGQIKIVNTVDLKGDSDYATLGYFVGKVAVDRVPVITGISPSVSQDNLKCLGTPFAVTGSVSHYHVVGVTPEAHTEEEATGNRKISASNTFEFGEREFKETEVSLSAIGPEEANLVILGCPHASITQLKAYAGVLSGRKVKSGIEMWVQTMHSVKAYAEDIGLAQVIESTGAKLVCNICPAAIPRDFFKKRGYSGAATDSAKMIYYVTTTQDTPCFYGRLEEFIHMVTR